MDTPILLKGREADKPRLVWPTLLSSEHYAGLILGAKTGAPSHHLILLPADVGDLNWDESVAWAAAQGGELPTSQEQALLFANLRRVFAADWYWSGEGSSVTHAQGQHFDVGYQLSYLKDFKYRARAIRRLYL